MKKEKLGKTVMKNNGATIRNTNTFDRNKNTIGQGRVSYPLKFNRKSSHFFHDYDKIDQSIRPRPGIRYPLLDSAYDFIPNLRQNYRGIDSITKKVFLPVKSSVDVWSNRHFPSANIPMKEPPKRDTTKLTILTPQHIPLPNERNRISTSDIQVGANDMDLKKYYIS